MFRPWCMQMRVHGKQAWTLGIFPSLRGSDSGFLPEVSQSLGSGGKMREGLESLALTTHSPCPTEIKVEYVPKQGKGQHGPAITHT